MYIEEIIIDGFKSYAKRTHIQGFDPTFNAITGLNGSGKSNILDSICFVLGITTLAQVRVSNLQELVYKQGQAGVTKASVTIIFNNSNKPSSPLGYEGYDKITVTRQVAIGNRNKYLINGHNAQAGRVQDLFHSVQLNINNPHFLIMQGRITKVLNMKPPEILAMIEEAAGTRMFEIKKKTALATIEKKQKKVEEISKMLAEEITPTLEKLRTELSMYNTWSNNQTTCERLQRFCIAYEYVKSMEMVQNQGAQLAQMTAEKESLAEAKEAHMVAIEDKKKMVRKLVERREKEMGKVLHSLEEREEVLSKEVVKHTATWKHKKDILEKERASVASLAKSREETLASIEQKRREQKAQVDKIAGQVAENDALGAALKTLQNKLHNITAGITTDDGDKENGSFTEQLMEAKRVAVDAASKYKQAEVSIRHLNDELTIKRRSANQETSDHKRMQAEHGLVEKEVLKLRTQLGTLEIDNTKEEELVARKREVEPSVQQLRERVGNMSAQLSGVEFTYTDPSKDFDRAKVKGVVANLVSLKDPETATALEVCAGGKLYNVVIDDEHTGKALLSRGNLKRRVTFLPLNKIDGRSIDQHKVRTAEKIAGRENVQPALNLIQYEKPLHNAMSFVFGTTFIAKDKRYAQQVAFNEEIKTKTISLEGDEYNPMGSLTGGSRPSSGSILTHIQALNELNGQYKKQQTELENINYQLAKLKSSSDIYRQAKQSLQLKEHELSLINSRLQLNPHHQLMETIKEIEANIETNTKLLEETRTRERESLKKAKELEEQANNFQARRDSQLKEMEKNIAITKEKFNKSNKIVKNEQQFIEKTTLEIEELESELKALSDQTHGNEGDIEALEKEAKQLESVLNSTSSEYDTVQQTLEIKREELKAQNKDIQNIANEVDQATKEITEIDINLKKVDHKLARFQKESQDAERYIGQITKQHPWIGTEKQFFGRPLGDYDFKAQDPSKAQAKLLKLQEDQERLSKTINKKVMSMFEKAEQEYKDLVEKKQIIEKDKEKIESVIKELDEKKNESLRKTWKQVNLDFGSIFSTLLPGTMAKLEPPEGQTELDGLEVKVAFGDVWKETLSELSGGQKSLLALSLILALLRFNPAPMYILDEIDAALDLSHTQNIGSMLKTHFTSSQFIVVSLKEGMFNNANVLFETRFVDGVSEVKRTTLGHHTSKHTRR
eukprot:gene8142-9557_t